MKKLWPHQDRDFHDLVAKGLQKRAEGGRISQAVLYGTAGGKTLTSLAILGRYFAEKTHDFYLITAPRDAILNQFEREASTTQVVSTSSGEVILPKLVRLYTHSDFTHWLSRRETGEVGLVTHGILRDSQEEVAAVLRGGRRGLLVSDEAHRTYILKGEQAQDQDEQKLSSALFYLTSLGLDQEKLSGTAYRSDVSEQVVDFDAEDYVQVSVPELMLMGFCPTSIVSEVIPVDCEGTSDKATEYVPEQIEAAAEAILEAWQKDGCPGSIVRIKHHNQFWNQEAGRILTEAFEPFVRSGQIRKVVNAIGEDDSDLNTALEEEARLIKEGVPYDQIKYVIIAIHRATEGINSPTATHGYCFGVPTVVQIIEQFIGRFLRLKYNLNEEGVQEGPICPGFDERWIDQVKISFVLARINDVDRKHAETLLKTILFMDSFKDIKLLRRLLELNDGFRRAIPLDHVKKVLEGFNPKQVEAARRAIQEVRALCGGQEGLLFREGTSGAIIEGLWTRLVEQYVKEGAENGLFPEVNPAALKRALAFDAAHRSEERRRFLEQATGAALKAGALPADAIQMAIEAYYEEFRNRTLDANSEHSHWLPAEAIRSFSGVIRQKILDREKTRPKSHQDVFDHVDIFRSTNAGRYPSLEETVPSNPEWKYKEYDGLLCHGAEGSFPVVEGGLPRLLIDRHLAGKTWGSEAQDILSAWEDKRHNGPEANLRELEQTTGYRSVPDQLVGLFGTNPLAAYYPKAVLCLQRYEFAAEMTVEEAKILGGVPAYKEPRVRRLVNRQGLEELRRRITCRELGTL